MFTKGRRHRYLTSSYRLSPFGIVPQRIFQPILTLPNNLLRRRLARFRTNLFRDQMINLRPARLRGTPRNVRRQIFP